ncbi:MAG TPA: redoxin domain-containing protein [Candidatus Dormibacteraeota bacterium]|nr:redoxin domain-containing protein [Candidatus Dormibacteraeota bacterium]
MSYKVTTGIIGCVALLQTGLAFAAPATADPLVNDISGVAHHPLAPGDKTGSVLIFYGQDCPISNSYAPEINRIVATFTNFAFYIVQVDPDLKIEAAKQHARQYALRPPVLLDPDHELVRRAGATVTPEAVVIGKNGDIVYRGRIDNLYLEPGKKRTSATSHDLRDAIESIQGGHRVKLKETKAIGCII